MHESIVWWQYALEIYFLIRKSVMEWLSNDDSHNEFSFFPFNSYKIYHLHDIPLWHSWYSTGYFIPVYFHLLCFFFLLFTFSILCVRTTNNDNNLKWRRTKWNLFVFGTFFVFILLSVASSQSWRVVSAWLGIGSSRHGIMNRKNMMSLESESQYQCKTIKLSEWMKRTRGPPLSPNFKHRIFSVSFPPKNGQ